MQTNNDYVKQILANKEIVLIGFADLSEIDETVRRGFKYGISIAVALKVFPSTGEATVEYFNEYKRVSAVLKEASYYLADKIGDFGYNAFALAGERQNEQYRTALPYKTLATQAGIGWIGKSAALITKEYGNAIRLNGVLTDMPLETGTPTNSSLCGDCCECVKNCPGKAITGNQWDIYTDRDDLLDAFACKKAVIDRGQVLGVTEGSCGICLSVCPWTKRYIENM
jgi:epoxyqueuosine reductase